MVNTPIRCDSKAVEIKPNQSPTRCTIGTRESRRVFPIPLEIMLICAIPDEFLHLDDMVLALLTVTPIACLLRMKFMVNTTEGIFAMISGANVENISRKSKVNFQDIANCSIATIRLFE